VVPVSVANVVFVEVEVNVFLVVGLPVPYVVLKAVVVALDVPIIVPLPKSVKYWVRVLLLVDKVVTPNGIVS